MPVVDGFLGEPVVVYLAASLAAALLLVEVALPTMGIAGTLSVLLGAVAVAGIVIQDEAAWPMLLLAAVGVGLWAVGLARGVASRATSVAAAGCFAAGSIGFAIGSEDAATFVVALAASVAAPLAYPRLRRATARLMAEPPSTGMEALVGRTATVARWDAGRGMVRLEGSLWAARTASSSVPPSSGDTVDVTGFDGITLVVAPHVRYGVGDGR